MAQAAWLKKYLRIKPEVSQIFDDLEKYLDFCREYGYVYDEKHLYNERTPWGEYNKLKKARKI